MKLFLIWTSGLGKDVILRHFPSRALATPCINPSETVCAIVVEAIRRNNSVKLF